MRPTKKQSESVTKLHNNFRTALDTNGKIDNRNLVICTAISFDIDSAELTTEQATFFAKRFNTAKFPCQTFRFWRTKDVFAALGVVALSVQKVENDNGEAKSEEHAV